MKGKKIALISGIALVSIVSATVGAYAATDIKLIVNGKQSTADIQIIDGSSYVSLRAVAEMLGADVKWDDATRTITIAGKDYKPAAPTSGSTVQSTSNARVDFHSAEHIAASKDRLAKEYPDSFATQKMLQDAAIQDQSNLENLVNSLTDSEWSALKAAYTRLVNEYSDSPSTVYMLFKNEVDTYRSMK